MTTIIKPADLSKTVYRVGGYFEADGEKPSPYDNSGIRGPNTPKSSSGRYHDANSDVNKHFFIQEEKSLIPRPNALSFSLELEKSLHPKDVPVYKLKFLPTGVTNDIVYYLSYFDKNITSTIIPTDDESVCCFITDELSGCDFFIDKLPNGKLVCYHANADPSAQGTMDTQLSTARQNYPGVENVASLHKSRYFAKPEELIKRKVKMGRTKVEFWGRTTVMGFRVDGKWEFWFQTYSRLSYKRPPGIARWLKGEVVKAGDLPLEIVDSGPVWP